MRFAVVQHDIVWEDRAANFARLAPQVARAAGAGAEFVLLSETFSTGFSMTPGIGEPEGGPSARFLQEQAAEHGVWVAGSCPEVAPDTGGEGGGDAALPYNSFVLAGPDGTVHRYRKLHPFTHGGEHERFRAGEKPVTVEVGGLRVTPFICYDLRFPELYRHAAKLGTDLFLTIASWPAPRTNHWVALLQARAIENQAFVLGNNRCGADPKLSYDGRSLIVDYAGNVLADAGGQPGLISAELDVAGLRAWREKLPFLADMRTDLVR